MLWKARSIIGSGQIGLPTTLAELEKDRAALLDQYDDAEQKV